jgi:hypothetical protein
VDTELTLRIWDCLLLEGRSALFKFSLALLKLREDELCEVGQAWSACIIVVHVSL